MSAKIFKPNTIAMAVMAAVSVVVSSTAFANTTPVIEPKVVGELEQTINTVPMIMGRRSISASVIGGIAETQEMLDFCAEHNIVPDVEMITMQDINTAYERMQKSDVKYRFVIDMGSLRG